nr:unnamed protein product [Callosobruchus analis]
MGMNMFIERDFVIST